MSGWYWTKFCWGMLLIPLLVMVFTVVEGEAISFGLPLVAFVTGWMGSVLLLMWRLGVPPFTKGRD